MITYPNITKKQTAKEKKEKLNELLNEIKNTPYTTIEENIEDAKNNNVIGNPKYGDMDEFLKELEELI
jgi:hypothetical protein